MPFTCVVAPFTVASSIPAARMQRLLASLATLLLFALWLPAAKADSPRVQLSTSLGAIVLELDEQRAPQTVQNFLEYVDSGFYDNTLFHRVIEGFMIQGGGFNQNYQKKSTRPPISNEAYNGLLNSRYTIAMARTTAPHSATSQFFINSEDNRNLDHTDTSQRGWGYAVFGRVVEGQDVIDNISLVRTGPGGPFSRDVPVEPIVILAATRFPPATDASAQAETEDVSRSTTIQATGTRLPVMAREVKDSSKPKQSVEQN